MQFETSKAIESEEFDDVEEESKGLDKYPSTEGNVVCCLFVCIAGPVMDALCALPGAVLDDVPASLRTSSLVLISLLGSPAIRTDSVYVLEQRAFFAILLGSCAFIGLNAAEASARNADAVLSFIGTLSTVLASSFNGVQQQQQDKNSNTRNKSKEHLSALCGALLFYIGMRVLRHSFALGNEVTTFKVTHDDITTRGYGVAVDMVATGNAFAGSCTVAFSCILLLNHDLVLHVGSVALSKIACTLACFVFAGAFAAQIGSFAAMEQLPALFSSNSCDGDKIECAAAFRARRLFTSSNSTSTAWIAAIALTFFGFSHQKRFRLRREHFEWQPELYSMVSLSVIGTAAFCCFIVFLFVDPSKSMNWSDIELLLLLVSIPICVLGWPSVACVAHASGQIIYISTRTSLHGSYDFSYFTHHALLATVALTVGCGVLSLFSYGLYTFDRRRLYSEPVEIVNGICLTSLVSVQTFLTIATLGMSAGYTGVYYSDGKGSWRISGYEFTVQHCVSFFFAASLYGTRYEHSTLKLTWSRAAWFALPPFLGLAWIWCISTDTSGSPYHQYVDPTSFLIGISVAIASWIGIGFSLQV